jgi:PIN domain nuclease of toxin-antitoxin system
MGRGSLVVVDTHALLWWVSDRERLGRRAARALREASQVGVPAICGFEIAMLVVRGRISLDRSPLEWIEQAFDLPRVEVLPLSPRVSVRASQIVGLVDPADRLVVASALVQGAPLVTKDVPIHDLGIVETIW